MGESGWGRLMVSACLIGWSCRPAPIDQARRWLEDGELERAGQAFFRIAKQDPAHLAAWDGAVDVWCRRKIHVARCLDVLDLELERLGTIARHKDALARSLELRAKARMDQGLAQAALQDLARARKATSDPASILALEVRAYAMLGEREPAIQAFSQLMTTAPRHPHLSELRALIPKPEPDLRETADHDEAGFGGQTTSD